MVLSLLLLGGGIHASLADETCPALAGYTDFAALSKRIGKLAESPLVTARVIGKSREGRAIHLLTIAQGDAGAKPAILVVGNVEAPYLVGGELAVAIAEKLVSEWSDQPSPDEAAAKKKITRSESLLNRYTLFVIPRPNPDGTERCLKTSPWRERDGNALATDDDRDFEQGEDPCEDLNGDRWITQMRVEDPLGEYLAHPDDPRVMIKADPKKGERGKYRLLSEGVDNDEDEAFNEDAGLGISFNRNFPFQYPYFKQGAGPYQVSEPMSRAVADFCYDHPHIFLVFTFSPEDNLFHPWKPKDTGRIKMQMMPEDAEAFPTMAEKYRKVHGGKNCPPSPTGNGSFTQWAYFHYGRWSLAARGWWVPVTQPPAEKCAAKGGRDNEGMDGKAADEKQSEDSAKAKPSGEKRGSDDINALNYFAAHNIDGFAEWQPLKDHPDFPGKRMEVGGFKPFHRLNPPIEDVPNLASKHLDFLVSLPEFAPVLAVANAEAESLGGGLVRIKATAMNEGALPTSTKMGQVAKTINRLQMELFVPEATEFVIGHRRMAIPSLDGNGGKHELTWLVRFLEDAPDSIQMKFGAPHVGEAAAEIPIK